MAPIPTHLGEECLPLVTRESVLHDSSTCLPPIVKTENRPETRGSLAK